MSTIQWRAEVNALTVPLSYKIRFMPRNVINTNDLAAEIVQDNPTCNKNLARSIISSLMRRIEKNLINGNQVTIDDSFSFGLSFTGRLDEPDDPLPPIEEMLHVKVRASANLLKEIRYQAKLERLPMTERSPVINAVEDTRLHLDDLGKTKRRV